MATEASVSGSSRLNASRAITAHDAAELSFFGAPPLIPGERADDYERLLAAVTDQIKPADIMETIWTREVVDLQWEIIRYRRIKADLITHHYDGFESSRNNELDGLIAIVVSHNITTLERIDHMIMTMEARRNAAYREVERHRIGLGERLRRAVEHVEDAEFREVDERTTIVPHDTTDKALAEPAQGARYHQPEICDRESAIDR
jgi:hypothetical protein